MMATQKRSPWIVAYPGGFDFNTERKNYVFMFDSLSTKSNIGLTPGRTVLRLAVRMSNYQYVYGYIRGEDKPWADFITRWKIQRKIRHLVHIPALWTASQDFH